MTRFLSASALALAIAFPAAAHSIVDVSVDQRGPAYVAANATLTYTVVVTDLAYDFSYGVVMTDVLPSGATFKSASGSGWNCTQSKGTVTCSAESIPPGASLVTIAVTSPSSPGTIHNRVSIENIGSVDPISANNASTFDTFVFNPSSCNASPPTLISLADQTTLANGSAHLAWTRVDDATRYRIFTAVEGAKPSLLVETAATSIDVNFEPGSQEWWVDAVFESCPPISSAHAHLVSHGNPLQLFVSDLATSSSFQAPASIGVDSYGKIYVLDVATSTLSRIDPSGAVTIVAGQSGVTGSIDGPGQFATMNHPLAMTTTGGAYTYIVDSGNSSIRQFYPDGNGVFFGPLLATIGGNNNFKAPAGIVAAPSYVLTISDTGNNTIRQMANDFTVKTVAAATPFNAPTGLAIDAAGNIYIADTGNNIIRKLGTDGVVTTIAGLDAQFNHPTALAVDSLGNLVVADTGNHSIRRIAPSGFVTTLLTGLDAPTGLAFDASGRLLIADREHSSIRVATIGPPATIPSRRRAASH